MNLNKTIIADVIDGLKQLPDNSIHCIVTSPPYWGLREYRENGVALPGQIGLEKTPEEFIEKMVAVFREVRRVLRDDGTCWMNLGDSYNSQPASNGVSFRRDRAKVLPQSKSKRIPRGSGRWGGGNVNCETLKPKDLCGIPWRVALALQADGWWLRSDIIWNKPNPMPESVTDRPTKSHEYIFLLTKSARYFYDADAVREEQKQKSLDRYKTGWDGKKDRDRPSGSGYDNFDKYMGKTDDEIAALPGRNLRSVWTIATQAYAAAHFATFPEALPSRCIRAGTSEWGCCPKCGAQWVRVVEHIKGTHNPQGSKYQREKSQGVQSGGLNSTTLSGVAGTTKTLGFWPDCCCGYYVAGKCVLDPVPCIVLDPFHGSGTTGKVAQDLHRDWIGIDLGYKDLSDKRTQQQSLI